uniref:Uncharacterized protein n=1 Tax=Arundo donax TaxID=35708 RepID=A0A0A9E9D4_ARUDO
MPSLVEIHCNVLTMSHSFSLGKKNFWHLDTII